MKSLLPLIIAIGTVASQPDCTTDCTPQRLRPSYIGSGVDCGFGGNLESCTGTEFFCSSEKITKFGYSSKEKCLAARKKPEQAVDKETPEAKYDNISLEQCRDDLAYKSTSKDTICRLVKMLKEEMDSTGEEIYKNLPENEAQLVIYSLQDKCEL